MVKPEDKNSKWVTCKGEYAMLCKRRELLKLLAYLPIMASQARFASSDSSWPAKPLRLVVPFLFVNSYKLGIVLCVTLVSQKINRIHIHVSDYPG